MAAGILISRIVGLVRQRVFSHYFGQLDEADAFYAAFRVPNFLQNLFGEGVLSASFIPVYARLLAEGDEEESGRVAGAVGAILALATSVIVLAGVLLDAVPDLDHRSGVRGRQARTHHPAGAHSFFPAPDCWCFPRGRWGF